MRNIFQVSRRDFHKCIHGGKWARPEKVRMKCSYDEEKIRQIQSDVSMFQSEISKLQSESLVYAERVHHCKSFYLELVMSVNHS